VQLLDVLKERLKDFRASHTYPVYKKLQEDVNNPFYPKIGDELNHEIKRIVENEWRSARVIEDFDYGLGGLKNMLFYIDYNRHRIFFAIDIFNVVLVNYYTENEVENNDILSNYDICLLGPDKQFAKVIYYLDESFYAINTYNSFLNYGEELGENNQEISSDLNSLFWNDFKKYVNNQTCLGTHDVLQIGNILINCNFTKGVDKLFRYTSKLWVD